MDVFNSIPHPPRDGKDPDGARADAYESRFADAHEIAITRAEGEALLRHHLDELGDMIDFVSALRCFGTRDLARITYAETRILKLVKSGAVTSSQALDGLLASSCESNNKIEALRSEYGADQDEQPLEVHNGESLACNRAYWIHSIELLLKDEAPDAGTGA